MKKIAKILFISIFILISGCSSTSKNLQNSPGKKLEEVIEIEKSYTKKAPKDSIGLALSGGGVRSASFNIGLLGGLYNTGLLKDIDYISSVSGGGYAAYWYYTKLNWNQGDQDNFFNIRTDNKEEYNSDYRFQEYLENNMKLGIYSLETSGGSLDKLKTGASVGWRVAYSIPFALIDTLQISRITENNFTPMPKYFRNSIERVYGFYPEKDTSNLSEIKGDFVNRGERSWRLKEFNFEQLKKLYSENSHIPIWIIGTTADVNNSWPRWTNSWKKAPDLEDSYFEFTPFTYGNNRYNYHRSQLLPDEISHFVQISSAAIDSADPYNLKGAGIFTSFISMGDYVKVEDKGVYLSDGGHSENLGVYPLLKRGVGKIIISDAEYGEGERLTGLIRLIENLKDEYTFEFEDEHFNNYIEQSRKDIKNSQGSINMLFSDSLEIPNNLPSILKGSATEKATGKKMEIYYVKLRIGKNELIEGKLEGDIASKEVLKNIVVSTDKKDEFMEDDTSNLWYTSSEYRSYFFLGDFFGNLLGETLEK